MPSNAWFCDTCRIIRNKELDRESDLRKQAKRKIAVGIKYCERCKIEQIESSNRVKYCVSCKPLSEKERNRYNKRKSTLRNKRKGRNELDVNFRFINPSGRQLIPSEFDKISEMKNSSYSQRFIGGWTGVMRRYGKFDELREFIISDYISWSEENKNEVVGDYVKHIKISTTLMDKIIYGEELRRLAGHIGTTFTEDEMEVEFNRVMNLTEEIPSATEFNGLSNINIYSYSKRRGFKGNSYLQLLEYYKVCPEKIEVLKQRLATMKKNSSSHLIGVFKVSREDLTLDFISTFDTFYEEYGTYPSVTQFDKLAKHGLTTYNNRFGKSYLEIAEELGYEVDRGGSPTENYVLKNFSDILGSDYTPQANFDWMRSKHNRRLRCDGYFKDYNLIVEYDGKQHSEMIPFFGQESFERTQANDKIKNELIPKNNIKLLRIAYNEPYWDNDFLKMRLYEHGIIPNNYSKVYDSNNQVLKLNY